MSAIVKEVYDAFRSAGVSDAQATAAAQSIPVSEGLATKADIGELRTEMHTEFGAVRAEMKDLELRMTVKFFTGLGIAIAGIKALDFLIG